MVNFYDVNAGEALRVPHLSNCEKYFTFLTALIFSGDRFSGHYGLFTVCTGTGQEYYEGTTPPPKERRCPEDMVNYLVAYRKPEKAEVVVKKRASSWKTEF